MRCCARGSWRRGPSHYSAAALASAYEQMREYALSAETLKKAIEATPSDRGELRQAITLLERGPVATPPRRPPRPHQLRLWYALADLYERVGDAPRARELFGRIAAVDPDEADTAERLAALA